MSEDVAPGSAPIGDLVIVAYRPKPGCAADLLTLAARHVPALRRLGLASDRPAQLMRARDGTILEMFEWRPGAIARAHAMPEIQAMWEASAAVCDYVTLRDLAETAELFAQFEPVGPPL